MQLLRRILAGLAMLLVALLPGPSHALAIAGRLAHADSAGPSAAQTGPHTAGGHRLGNGRLVGERRASDNGVPGCAGHRHGAPGSHKSCADCAMACCAPAIVGLMTPIPAANDYDHLRRAPLRADRARAGTVAAERLRPPISF